MSSVSFRNSRTKAARAMSPLEIIWKGTASCLNMLRASPSCKSKATQGIHIAMRIRDAT